MTAADIFLSYNREDQSVARRFAEAFEAEGFSVWWDTTLRAGEAYDEVTETALRTAKAVVVLWSPRSVVSRWVRAEATLADRNRTLVPCTIEPCDRPIMFELTQTADLSHWQGDVGDQAWRGFLTDIERFVGRRRSADVVGVTPTPPQPTKSRVGERRQIAVLNCALSPNPETDLDPEDWHGIVSRFRADAERVVSAFGGKVIDAPGDGLMAFFGIDLSREDDAIRAVNAALELCEQASPRSDGVGKRVPIQVGIDIGPVVVGHETAAPFGAPINAAVALQTQAPADCVIISPAVATLVGGYFELESQGARAFRVVAAHMGRTRFDLSRARGLSSFVGRDTDLQTLQTALDHAASGEGQVVGVVAEAGAGKSRLCFEFAEHCRAQGLQVFTGRGVAHGKNLPFLPILDLIRSIFDVQPDDDGVATRQKIDTRLSEFDQSVTQAAPLLFEFLGVNDPERPAPRLDPDARQRQLIGLLRHLITLAGGRQPTVVLIEDLHWIDAASLAFLDNLVDGRAGSRNLLLLNFRPEFHAGWMQNAWYRQIPLAPLGSAAIQDLLADHLGDDPSLSPLVALIESRAKGNPFFVEEIVQSLTETRQLEGERGACRLVAPVSDLRVPATVHAVLAARIDRLQDRDKQLLQTAAVIGKDFAESVLEAIADLSAEAFDAALTNLKRAELIQEVSLYPVTEYAFRHPLTHEVALSGLLKDRRRETHAAVARIVEANNPTQLDERAALLAHHREEAGEPFLAAGWHARAAAWAGLTSGDEALRHWQRARALVSDLPHTPETLRLAVETCVGALVLSWRLGTPDSEITAVYEQGKALAEEAGDIAALATLEGNYGCFLGLVKGGSDDYYHYAREAVRLADQTGDPGLQIAQRAFLGYGSILAGRFRDGLASTEWALENLPADVELGRQYSGYSPYLGLRHVRAWILIRSGLLMEGRDGIARTEALARECGDSEILTWLQLANIEAATASANAVTARGHATVALAAGERSATPQSRMVGVFTHGVASRLEGNWDQAVTVLEEAVRLTVDGANREFEGAVRAALAIALLERGDLEAAQGEAMSGVDTAHQQASRYDEVCCRVALARVHIAQGDAAALDLAEESLTQAQILMDEFGIEVFRPDLHECRGRIAIKRGTTDAGRAEIGRAIKLLKVMDAPLRSERLAKEFLS
jgi:adenylate cyclase